MIVQLLKSSPQLHILLVGSRLEDLILELQNFMKECNGTIDICLYENEPNDELKTIANKIFQPKDYDSFCNAISREYEYIIVHDVLHKHHNPIKLLKTLYRSLENSAQIIILQKHNPKDARDTQELLEKCEFRAANTISHIYQDYYDAIIARKLHMWGNGL